MHRRSLLHSFTAFVSVWIISNICAQAGISVEHAFGNDRYAPAGVIDGFGGLTVGEPTFLRTELGTEQKRQLSRLAADDGIYTVRINNPGSSQQKYLSTSVRARCLLTANQERIRLHVDEEGAVIGVQYEVTPSECAAVPVDPAVEVQLPVEVPVTLEFPKPAPNVIFTGGEDPIGAARGKKAAAPRSQPQQQQQQQEQGAQAGSTVGAEGAGGQKAGPPKEEQTWFQRNWVYIAILFGLGLQVLKAQLEPQMQEMQRQQEAQRRGPGAAAAAPPALGANAAGGARSQGASRRRS